MNTVEIPTEERIEAARARLKTAYDQYQSTPPAGRELARLKWEERKMELNVLLNSQNTYHP